MMLPKGQSYIFTTVQILQQVKINGNTTRSCWGDDVNFSKVKQTNKLFYFKWVTFKGNF
jgi:hypothetical protein